MAKKSSGDATDIKVLIRQAAVLADNAARALAQAQQLRVQTRPVLPFPLDPAERTAVAGLPALPAQLRKKLAGRAGKFTATEVISMVMAAAKSSAEAERERGSILLRAGMKLIDGLHANVLIPQQRARAKRRKPTGRLYQLKITLLGSEPAIWRRIQVMDCTLDKLHEHIQTVMGWTNSHLHQFDIGDQLYGDPELMQENFVELNFQDSTTTLFSDVVPQSNMRFAFQYLYDFGDSWTHEVLVEGCPEAEPRQKYPLCLEGERACPPEDVGGVLGYAEFLKTIHDRDHTERVEMLEWVEGWFDPEEFDPATATKSMKKGLPDWRKISDTGL